MLGKENSEYTEGLGTTCGLIYALVWSAHFC